MKIANKANFSRRKAAIRELVQSQAVGDQAALLELLHTVYGIQTNQAAISRDLRSLGIVKRARGGSFVYELPTVDVVMEILGYAVKSIRHNEVMVVVNTVPGTAAFVGDFLDGQKDLKILGTLAGENTVVVMPQSVNDLPNLVQQLMQRIKLKGN